MEQLKRGSLKGIFVTQDDPEFLEEAVDPEQVILDLNNQRAGELRSTYLQIQGSYSTTPFDVDGKHLRLFPGGVTIWSGFPGSGKTTLLRQLTCHLLIGGGVFFASLE